MRRWGKGLRALQRRPLKVLAPWGGWARWRAAVVLVLVFGLVREQQVGRQTGWERELWLLGELGERAGRLLAPVTLAARCDKAGTGDTGHRC